MITLHILQYLKESGFGTNIDSDLFFEVLPLGKNGIAIYSRGGLQERGRATVQQNFDLYIRGNSNTIGADKAEKVRTFLAASYGSVCDLPTVPTVSNRKYKNCRFVNIGNVENLGLDENDRIVYRLGAQINYNKI